MCAKKALQCSSRALTEVRLCTVRVNVLTDIRVVSVDKSGCANALLATLAAGAVFVNGLTLRSHA